MLNSSAINSNHSSLEAGLETGKGWCVSNDSRPYLRIDFGKLVTVSKIETQGAVYDGESYFLSSYNLKFGYSNPRWFDDVEQGQVKELVGNLDSSTKVENQIGNVMLHQMQLIPKFPEANTIICLRLGIYGCASGYAPSVNVNPSYLRLSNEETGKITCDVQGQVNMNVQFVKPASDMVASESTSSKNTQGIMHNETKTISFKKPNVMIIDESCRLDEAKKQVVCSKNFSCRASYLFAKNLSVTKEFQVEFGKDVTLAVTINDGMLSPVSANIKSTRKLKCQVRSQAATTVRWSNKINQKWTAEYENSSLKDGAMNYLQTSFFSLKPKASEVINSLKCTLAGERLQCNTEFVCSSSYNFNARISKSSSIEVHLLLDLPGKPEVPSEECQSRECTISWAAPRNLGAFDASDISYEVSILGESASVRSTKHVVGNLKPNSDYTVEIRTKIVHSDGKDSWRSQPVTRKFKTMAVGSEKAPHVSKVSSTDTSIYVKWEQMTLLPENGEVLNYVLELSRLMYGENKIAYQDVPKNIKLDKTNTRHTFKDLKPWSRYKFAIKALTTEERSSKTSEQTIDTKESVPSAPPTDITAQTKNHNGFLLQWKAPLREFHNGRITAYTVKWRSSKRSKRNTRAVPVERKMTKSADELKCGSGDNVKCEARINGLLPYHPYTFRVAAATKIGHGDFSPPKTFLTAQAAPSAPVKLSCNPNSTTFFLMWQKPLKLNGVLKEYGIEVTMKGLQSQIVFTGSKVTYFDTKINFSKALSFRVQGYTENFHTVGGLAGEWSYWFVATRKMPPAKPVKLVPGPATDPTLTIVLSFVIILALLVSLIAIFFHLYRRRQMRKDMQRLEVEMDSVIDDADNENMHVFASERQPLARNLGSHETVDMPVEDHAHRPIPLSEFADYVSRMKEDDDDLFCNEYRNELMSGKCYPSEIAVKSENKAKNRYVNITAYDHSRVILKPDGGKRGSHHHHHYETDYINANYIEGYCPESPTKYIASHGPTESVIADFWRMVWQEKSNVIVMLTNLEEGEKIKCHQYWPSAGAAKYGNVTVRFHSSDQTADYLIRTFEIEKTVQKEKEKRFLTQFHFVSWPDHGVPDFPTAILSLRRRVRHYYNGHSPMIVHCSAGVGRTGCFILIDAMLERIDNDEGTVDVFNYLQYMRTRRINMVQTLDQYIFAHTAVLEHITFGNTEISVIDLETRVRELENDDGIGREFELIESTSEDIASEDNISKVLMKSGKFVDVFYVDGYKQRDAFFVCNSPSYNFTPDFWEMLVERECHTIVMLNRLEEPDTYKYWPDLNQHQTYGNSTVLLASEHQNGNIMTRKFKITLEKDPRFEYEVQHFQFLDWPIEEIPKNKNSILTLMSLIEKSQQNFGNAPVLVHSGKNAARSGTFISIYNSTERLKVEQLIDVLQCVRAIRTVVAGAVRTTAQYRFIYSMIRTYLEAFETYSNFQDPCQSMEEIS